MTTTQNSSQVQPEPILTVGTYHGGSVLISKLALGGESIYIRNSSKGAKFFPLLKDAFLDLYDTSVSARVQYKKSSPGRDRADEHIKAILDWLHNEQGKGFGAVSLTDVAPVIQAINKHYGFSPNALDGTSHK